MLHRGHTKFKPEQETFSRHIHRFSLFYLTVVLLEVLPHGPLGLFGTALENITSSS